MVNLYDIRYLRIGTPNLESAVEFATKIVGLQLVGREGKAAYFRSDKTSVRGDTRDHTLVYFEGDPAVFQIEGDRMIRRVPHAGLFRGGPFGSYDRLRSEKPRGLRQGRRRDRKGGAPGALRDEGRMRAAPRPAAPRLQGSNRQQDRDRGAAVSQRRALFSRARR